MGREPQEPGVRQVELLRALGEQAAPRPVGWLLVIQLVLVGAVVMALVVAGIGGLKPTPPPRRERAVDTELLASAMSAYGRADWDQAERLFRSIHERFPDHKRAEDYLDRIELTRRDAETLARAEEALVSGQAERARAFSARVASNSPLFAQAENLSRTALSQPPRASATGAGTGSELAADELSTAVEVRAVLGEALALYEDGKFEEAAQRARGLAERATGPAEVQLSRWATDAMSFGNLYRALPAADADLLRDLNTLQRAVELDQRLSDGHFARGLSARGAKALLGRALALSQNGQLVDACAELIRAQSLSSRTGDNPPLERRCEAEAARRNAQARSLERRRPEDARALYEQARALAPLRSPARKFAEQALAARERDAPR